MMQILAVAEKDYKVLMANKSNKKKEKMEKIGENMENFHHRILIS